MVDISFQPRQLVAVEYPGVVENNQAMLKTLGGEKEVSKVYNEPSRRLELKFRPDDLYCKCGHGDRFNTTNLLMKVTKRKKLPVDGATPSDQDAEYKVEILGVVGTTFKFKAMMDFQYLPMERNASGVYNSLIPMLVPQELHSASWLQEEAPLFIPPVLFSRLDIPQYSYFRRDPQPRDPNKAQPDSHHPPNIIGRTRQRRAGFAIFSNYEDENIPSGPKPQALEQLKLRPCDPQLLESVKQAFVERPVWSRSGLLFKLKCDRPRLKYVLPTVAYYFLTGPWRSLWVKFGYDPRKDPSSKKFQLLDFRIKTSGPNDDLPIKSKRSAYHYTLPTKCSQSQPRIATIQTDELAPFSEEAASGSQKECEKVPNHIFVSGVLPQYRQCFYQLCDIHMDSVQKLVHSNDGRERSVHERNGFCQPGVLDKCREILTQDLKCTMRNKSKEESKKIEVEPLPQPLEEEMEDSDQESLPSDQELETTNMEEGTDADNV